MLSGGCGRLLSLRPLSPHLPLHRGDGRPVPGRHLFPVTGRPWTVPGLPMHVQTPRRRARGSGFLTAQASVLQRTHLQADRRPS